MRRDGHRRGVRSDIMKIQLTSVLVDDQEKAVKFYTEVLGFVRKKDIPMGEARWLTVVSPEGPEDIELLLEPNGHSAARPSSRRFSRTGSR
jgi:catechol 2,3-dioxygenase-like lactoylglutathione lyase family enzyme